MSIETRIYAGGAFAFGQQAAVDSLLAANYSAIIIWSVHVDTDGTLFLNNTKFVVKGVYTEADKMDIPAKVAQLHKANRQIIFSVGAGGTKDFTNIEKLLNGGVPGPGNILYDNFKALKDAMVKAGGDIDAIDFDNEDNMDTATMVNFGLMLSKIGYNSVTFCPWSYTPDGVWADTYHQLLKQKGNSFVSAIHLQCYSGGINNDPQQWGPLIANAKAGTLLIAGLATSQTQPGPWWDGDTNSPGGSVVKTPSVAMFKDADWSGMLWKGNFASPDLAMQKATGAETFFFYCNGFLDLGPGRQFQKGDTVFFCGYPWWGSAPQCDAYALSGGCSNIYNNNGSCPGDLQTQYKNWNHKTYPVNGGFIWMYDSIVNCVLSGCCGEKDKSVTDIATDYQKAIVNGLS